MATERIPLIELNRFEDGFKENFLQDVSELLDNTQFIACKKLILVLEKLTLEQ